MNFEIYLQFFKNIFVYFLTLYIYIYIYSFYRYFSLKMAGKNTGVSTRSKGAIKFSALSSPLDKTEPPTFDK